MNPNTSSMEALLWELVEGTIEEGDRAALYAYLAEHAEARVQLERIRAMRGLLGAVPSVEPPPSLLEGIERALASQPPPIRRAAAWRVALGELVAPRWRVRLAWAAAGLAVGAGVVVLMLSDLGRTAGRDEAKFYGAVHTPGPDTARGLVLELSRPLGRILVRRPSGQGEGLDFELEMRPSARGAALELSGAGIMVRGFGEKGLAASTLIVNGDRATVRFEAGKPVGASVAVESRDGPIRAKLTAGGETLLDRLVVPEEVPKS